MRSSGRAPATGTSRRSSTTCSPPTRRSANSLEGALERAAARVRAIEDDMERLGRAPFQGTLREDLRPGLRQVTKRRAVFYFTVDEAAEQVRVLAVFFGGQDHLAEMLRRLGRARG